MDMHTAYQKGQRDAEAGAPMSFVYTGNLLDAYVQGYRDYQQDHRVVVVSEDYIGEQYNPEVSYG